MTAVPEMNGDQGRVAETKSAPGKSPRVMHGVSQPNKALQLTGGFSRRERVSAVSPATERRRSAVFRTWKAGGRESPVPRAEAG